MDDIDKSRSPSHVAAASARAALAPFDERISELQNQVAQLLGVARAGRTEPQIIKARVEELRRAISSVKARLRSAAGKLAPPAAGSGYIQDKERALDAMLSGLANVGGS